MGIFNDELGRLRSRKRLTRLINSFEHLTRRLPVELAMQEQVEGETDRDFRDRVVLIHAEICGELAKELDGNRSIFSESEYRALMRSITTPIYGEYWDLMVSLADSPQIDTYTNAQIKRQIALRRQYGA